MNEVEMEHRLTETEALTRDNARRINDLEADYKVLQELTSSVKVMAEQFKTMNEKINKIDKTVQRLTGKPGAMWEGAVKTIVTAVVGGIIGYALFRLGLKA